jgi:hypothetical protein
MPAVWLHGTASATGRFGFRPASACGCAACRSSSRAAERATRFVGSVLLAGLAAGALYALVGDRRSLALLLDVVFAVFEAQRLVTGRRRPRTAHA